MLYKAGDKGANIIYRTHNEFESKFDLAGIAQILSVGTNGGGLKEMIDVNGTIVLKNYVKGINCLNALYYSKIPGKYKARSMFSFFYIVKCSNIDPVLLVARIEKNLIKWIEPRSVQEAKRVMINCYNFGLQDKFKIKEGV